MPGRNGTGPMGRGAMTGRGAGCCDGAVIADYASDYGRRNGMGFGFGQGQQQRMGYGPGQGLMRRNAAYMAGCRRGGRYFADRAATDAPLTDKEFLRIRKEHLQNQLEWIDEELDSQDD